MFQKVERLLPIEENVYMVVPEAFLDQYRSLVSRERLLPPENIISNGASAPGVRPPNSTLRDLQTTLERALIVKKQSIMAREPITQKRRQWLYQPTFTKLLLRSRSLNRSMCSLHCSSAF